MGLRRVWLLLPLAACAARAQEESSTRLANPFDTAAGRAEGARTFLSQCASCHGRDGKGGQGTPDLTSGAFRRASSDEGIYQVIAKGVPGTTMPAFSLPARQLWELVAFLRSLRAEKPEVRGDAALGRALYQQHCATCHDAWAPPLAQVSRGRSPAELRRSILEPNAEVSSDYWRLRAVTRDGRTFTGRRLNEDTYSVQFLEDNGGLRGLEKSALLRYEVLRASPMPSFQGRLTAEQLDGVLAYLAGGMR